MDLKARAAKKATQSLCKFKVAALGINKNGICVMSRTNKPRFGRKGGGLHAEAQVMAKAQKRGIVSILICRVGKNGDLLPIDPCPTCQGIADKLGIKLLKVEAND